jgi:hypothetical protein
LKEIGDLVCDNDVSGIPDTGYWILDTGYWILDTGYCVNPWIELTDIMD